MRVSVLGSGSGGNCTYVATQNTAVLVDLGFGRRSLRRRLHQAGIGDHPIHAILLTHGHSDHIKGVLPFLSKHCVTVYMNQGTRSEVPGLQSIDRWEYFSSGSTFSVGDLEILAFEVSHDATEPVGFRFSARGVQGALATDLGELTPKVTQHLSACDWLALESNHDVEMLKIGPYPLPLKQRVLSNQGHLSNQELSRFLSSSFDGRAAHLFLAHLSRQNNHPQVALDSASRALAEHCPLFSPTCAVHLTHQSMPSIALDF